MGEQTLPLNDKSRDELWVEGRQRYCADDRDHPSARFFIKEDQRLQREYEAMQQQALQPVPSEQAMQLVLFSAMS